MSPRDKARESLEDVKFRSDGERAVLQARTQLFRRWGGGGGGCTLSLSGPHVSSSLNIYLCIIRKVHPSLLKKNPFFCVLKIRNIVLSITKW